MDNQNQNNMMKLNEWYSRRDVQISLDIIRIATLILMCMLLYYMWQNVEEVKILGTDPCRYCEAKTNATCSINIDPMGNVLPSYELNISNLEVVENG